MSLCPNSSCIVCKSVPCSKRWVANEWRSMCTCTRCLMPARCAASFSTFTNALAEYGSTAAALPAVWAKAASSGISCPYP